VGTLVFPAILDSPLMESPCRTTDTVIQPIVDPPNSLEVFALAGIAGLRVR
jgi:hypothetical protein